MLNKVLSFLLRMMMVACVLVCCAQSIAFFSGVSPAIQASLIIAGGTVLTYKMAQIERRLSRTRSRKRPALHVVHTDKPIRVA